MNSSELIKIDYSSHFQDDDIVHAKVTRKTFQEKKKNYSVKLKSFELNSTQEFLDSKRSLPTIDKNKFDNDRYRAFYSNKSKVITKELEKHKIRSVMF